MPENIQIVLVAAFCAFVGAMIYILNKNGALSRRKIYTILGLSVLVTVLFAGIFVSVFWDKDQKDSRKAKITTFPPIYTDTGKIDRFIDKEFDVICYQGGWNVVSCVPLSSTSSKSLDSFPHVHKILEKKLMQKSKKTGEN
jgi:hypothetical protein